jgi:hypothetical protein
MRGLHCKSCLQNKQLVTCNLHAHLLVCGSGELILQMVHPYLQSAVKPFPSQSLDSLH